ncbi:unnamed protein product [Pedinophyceae sp. YPF-701]|nr:unnamed protein product [Pedinophyceae sp. YPF-701]
MRAASLAHCAALRAPCCAARRSWQRTVARAAQTGRTDVAEEGKELVAANADFFRALPLYAGGAGLVAILVNRTVTGAAPVIDAGSSQSRADLACIVMSAVLLLTGLSWLSLKPVIADKVKLEGGPLSWTDSKVPEALKQELEWAWSAAEGSAGATSMVVFIRNRCVLQRGMATEDAKPGAAEPGPIVAKVVGSGKANYLANLAPYPGRFELLEYLPQNTQAVVVQPLGTEGALVIGHDRVRGFSQLDLAWLSTVADKIEATVEQANYRPTGTGFK